MKYHLLCFFEKKNHTLSTILTTKLYPKMCYSLIVFFDARPNFIIVKLSKAYATDMLKNKLLLSFMN